MKSPSQSVQSARGGTLRSLRKSSTEGPMTRTPNASPRSSLSPNKSSPLSQGSKEGKESSSIDSLSAKRNGFLPPSLIPITNRRASAGHSIDMAFAHPAPPTAKSLAKTSIPFKE